MTLPKFKIIHKECIMTEINQNDIFFIIGVGRSGTTIFQEIMNAFVGFCNVDESHISDPLSDSCWTAVRRSKDFSNLEEFMKKKWTNTYFVEKTPDSILCLPEMYKQFPESNYIFLERNPLKIVLSQLNLFPTHESDIIARNFHIRNLIMNTEDLELDHEQYWAKLTLNQIRQQSQYKNLFRKSITIRYEEFISSPKSELTRIENYFKIKSYSDEVIRILCRPSSSSRNNKYDIKDIRNEKAMCMIREAAAIWRYTI